MPVIDDAIVERIMGGRPGRAKALIAAATAGVAAAAVTYKALRSA